MLTYLKRVFNFAFVDFYRNRGISIAAIFVLIITILVVTGLFFLHGLSNYLVDTIQNKIDITAYFKSDTAEQDILQIKDEIQKNSPDVKGIEYISKEAALADFTEKHKDSAVFSNALSEVGENPFLASLNITTKDSSPDQYQQISTILESDQFSKFIEKVDFSQKKGTIETIFSIVSNINTFGLGLGAILVIIVIVVVFNTIKLVINNSKDEIATMRIVGASNWFIRAPFIIEGAMFGFVSFVICFFITLAGAYFLNPFISSILPGFNVFYFFGANIWLILLIQLLAGMGLGVIASFIVVRKYLQI